MNTITVKEICDTLLKQHELDMRRRSVEIQVGASFDTMKLADQMIIEKNTEEKFIPSPEFQTHPAVSQHMAGMLPTDYMISVCEPTPGLMGLVNAAEKRLRYKILYPPGRFEDWIQPNDRFDWVIMNPPFSPMVEGYRWLRMLMDHSDNIICLLPWSILINSSRRMNFLMEFGLVSVTNLPRKAFPKTRIQCCIMKLQKGYQGETKFLNFNW